MFLGFISFYPYFGLNPGWRLRAEQEPQRATGSTRNSHGPLGALSLRSPTHRPLFSSGEARAGAAQTISEAQNFASVLSLIAKILIVL